jgi:molecular chaperone IbpA
MYAKDLTTFRTIHNSALIGFDELFRRINELEKPQTGFPPYDIIKQSEEKFVIKMAVAGYTKDQISVTLDTGKLVVTGKIKQDKSKQDSEFLYKGIAERDFTRTFTIADTVEVDKVSLSDGMLYVSLRNVIPDNKKPKIFQIE